MASPRVVKLTVTRQDHGGEPFQESTQAPVSDTSTVLDVLEWAKAGPWPTLAFRYSCRSGVCGSCGVMVNGRPVLACETNASGYMTSGLNVAPLARIPVLRDLVTDVDGFISRMREALTWLIPVPATIASPTPTASGVESRGAESQLLENSKTSRTGMPDVGDASTSYGEKSLTGTMLEVNNQTPAQQAAYRLLSECINCLLCYAACPVFPALANAPASSQTPKTPTETDPEFVGPAALALAQRWNLDSRDDGETVRTEAIAETEHGIWACTQDGSCTRVCPKGLDPKKTIGYLQKAFLG